MTILEGLSQNIANGVERVASGRFRKLTTLPEGALVTADYLHSLAREGRIFRASGGGAALNTASTGAAQTSFAATAPDFTLEVPSGTVCLPLRVSLTQAGTVAGGTITVIIGVENAAERSSGGTVFQEIVSSRTDGLGVTRTCIPYIAPTVASDTVGVAMYRTELTASVTTARTAQNADIDIQFGQDLIVTYLMGPASLKIYTFAASTAPSWFPTFEWAELPPIGITT